MWLLEKAVVCCDFLKSSFAKVAVSNPKVRLVTHCGFWKSFSWRVDSICHTSIFLPPPDGEGQLGLPTHASQGSPCSPAEVEGRASPTRSHGRGRRSSCGGLSRGGHGMVVGADTLPEWGNRDCIMQKLLLVLTLDDSQPFWLGCWLLTKAK
jgi:hypothetical protein